MMVAGPWEPTTDDDHGTVFRRVISGLGNEIATAIGGQYISAVGAALYRPEDCSGWYIGPVAGGRRRALYFLNLQRNEVDDELRSAGWELIDGEPATPESVAELLRLAALLP